MIWLESLDFVGVYGPLHSLFFGMLWICIYVHTFFWTFLCYRNQISSWKYGGHWIWEIEEPALIVIKVWQSVWPLTAFQSINIKESILFLVISFLSKHCNIAHVHLLQRPTLNALILLNKSTSRHWSYLIKSTRWKDQCEQMNGSIIYFPSPFPPMLLLEMLHINPRKA